MRVLEQLRDCPNLATIPPSTPLQQCQLDLSLLESSPLDGTELHEANFLLNSTLQDTVGLSSLARRYVARLTQAYEIANGELITARKQIAEQQELLDTRKKRKRGKRIALKGKFVFSTEEVLRIARIAEAETAARSRKKHSQKRTIDIDKEEGEDNMLEKNSRDSESDYIVVSPCK